MTKNLLASIFLLFNLVTFSIAQQNYKLSSPIVIPNYAYISRILGEYNDKLYVHRMDEKQRLDVFDTNLKQISDSEFSMSDVFGGLKLYSMDLLNDKIFITGSGYEENTKSRILYGAIVPVENPGFNPNWQKLN